MSLSLMFENPGRLRASIQHLFVVLVLLSLAQGSSAPGEDDSEDPSLHVLSRDCSPRVGMSRSIRLERRVLKFGESPQKQCLCASEGEQERRSALFVCERASAQVWRLAASWPPAE